MCIEPEEFKQLEELVKDMNADVKIATATTQRLEKEVFGNGRPGLVQEVARTRAVLKILTAVLSAVAIAIATDVIHRIFN